MFAGQSLGWGRYIGALGGWEKHSLNEVKFIDWFITVFKSNKKLWGFFGLTIRGFIWGLCIALPTGSIYPLIAGSLMGVVYAITLKLFYKKGWEYGEFLFGGVLWYSMVI